MEEDNKLILAAEDAADIGPSDCVESASAAASRPDSKDSTDCADNAEKAKEYVCAKWFGGTGLPVYGRKTCSHVKLLI